MAQEINLPELDPDQVSPLNLAFIGDSVYEVIIRTLMLAQHNGSVKDVSERTSCYTRATAQSRMILALETELSESEHRIFKRGRNVKSISTPKSCTVSEYRHATGLEALIGYLYLNREYSRILELVNRGIELLDNNHMEKTDHDRIK